MSRIPEATYCGAPPAPGHLAWNTDPLLAAVLLSCAVLYALSLRRKAAPLGQQISFWTGWAIMSLALVSPLCNLSVALFSARIAQHVILTTLAAPLLTLGHVERILWLLPHGLMARADPALPEAALGTRGQALAVTVFAAVMWSWHVPALYDATFASTLVYWAAHATLMGSALLLWFAAFRSSDSIAGVLCAVISTMLQMSLLGALLTFARKPLFAVHADTTWPWGLSQLQDQELGGLIMWVVGGLLVTGWAVLTLAEYMNREQVPAAARPHI